MAKLEGIIYKAFDNYVALTLKGLLFMEFKICSIFAA